MEECSFEFDVTNLPPMPDKHMTRVFQCPICGAKRTMQKRRSYYHFPRHNKPAGSGANVACWKCIVRGELLEQSSEQPEAVS